MLSRVLAALTGGAAGILVAAAFCWWLPVALPADEDARLLAGPGSVITERSELPYDFRWNGREYSSGLVRLTVPGEESGDLMTRLTTAGWRVRDGSWAARGGLTIASRTAPSGGLEVSIRRAQPPSLRWAGPLGWLLGAIAGVLLLSRVLRRRPWGAFLLLPASLYAAANVVTYAAGRDVASPDAPWVALASTPIALLSCAGVVVLVSSAWRVLP